MEASFSHLIILSIDRCFLNRALRRLRARNLQAATSRVNSSDMTSAPIEVFFQEADRFPSYAPGVTHPDQLARKSNMSSISSGALNQWPSSSAPQ